MKKKLQLLKKETYEVTYPLDRNNNSLRGHEISWSNSTFPMLVMPPSRLSIWRNQRAHTDDQHHSPIATWLHQQQPRTRGKGAKGQQNTVFTPNMDVSQSRLALKSIGLILKMKNDNFDRSRIISPVTKQVSIATMRPLTQPSNAQPHCFMNKHEPIALSSLYGQPTRIYQEIGMRPWSMWPLYSWHNLILWRYPLIYSHMHYYPLTSTHIHLISTSHQLISTHINSHPLISSHILLVLVIQAWISHIFT